MSSNDKRLLTLSCFGELLSTAYYFLPYRNRSPPDIDMQCSLGFSPPLPFSPPKTWRQNTLCATKVIYRDVRYNSACITARMQQTDPRTDQWAPENLGFLHIATITGPHGVKGEVKARAVGDFEKLRLGPGAHKTERYLLLPGRKYPRPCKILGGRRASQSGSWILRIDGVTAREQIAKLRGSRLFVKENDRPRLARNEYMVGDLVGCRVSLIIKSDERDSWYDARKGNVHYRGSFPIGVVDGVITREDLCEASGGGSTSAKVASDLLEVALLDKKFLEKHGGTISDTPEEAKRVLVPFVTEIVPFVDLERAVVVLDPPDGLLSIAVVNKKEKQRPPRGLLCQAKD